MRLSIHQNTSSGSGYRGSLEGWARAGIRYVELSDRLLDAFLETDSLAAAGSVLSDNGLTPVSAAAVLPDIWLPGPDRDASLEMWRLRCEQFAELGLEQIYCPSVTQRRVTAEDFAATPDAISEIGEITAEFGLIAMVEFIRRSTHLSTLRSTLQVVREAAHPSVRAMFDFFHFTSGLSRYDELHLLEPGELTHVHIQDLLDVPLELVDNRARVIPGDGIAPVSDIIRELADLGYDGALSVELFRSDYTQADPFEMASEIRRKCEAVMNEAGVTVA